MKKIIFLLIIISFIIGCWDGTTGEVVRLEGDEEQEITVKGASSEWCKEGSEWSMSSSGEHGSSAKMVIKGIVDSGKYKGYCHVRYDVSSEDVNANVDYYFKEDGSGYQVMDMNGQKIESSWTG